MEKHHKHKRDKQHFIAVVTDMIKGRGERMTELRLDVLNLLLQQTNPIGAYDLRDKLNAQKEKAREKKIEPASIYRCLDFLVSLGVVVKLESQNAFILCEHIGEQHQHVLMLCNDCGATAELHDDVAVRRLDKNALSLGFTPQHHVLEIHGTCRDCQH